MFVKSVVVVAAALLSLPAVAEPMVARQVNFGDLNLESDAGRATLQKRLNRAVASICAVNPVDDSAAVREAQDRCISETSAGLQSQVDAAVRASRAKTARLASN
ncbi:UrcA family protein [Sandaracinobacteroides hominis]|uniref:UrcA family protein n=1 Tax=Sandaracinobacteroides hominis TaxID=2780086 RepID=UPI0018F597E0|nr:UrcA family protein [Sandaracinobacteroides hominis]